MEIVLISFSTEYSATAIIIIAGLTEVAVVSVFVTDKSLTAWN